MLIKLELQENNLREEQLSIREKERKEKISENKKKKQKLKIEFSEKKNKKMSAFAKKKEVESALLAKEKVLVLMYKDVYFTNEFHSFLPYDEFIDVFPEEVRHELPLFIEHQINLIPGSLIPNRPAYKTILKKIKEIQKQVNELLQKGVGRESLSPCSVLVILVPKKDGTSCALIGGPLIKSL
ncbi:hypothetical protein CR513_03597, partial [Mucuna pruriens]